MYVLPGMAISPEGDVILLNDPTPFDLSTTAEGLLCLFLTYNESRPMAMSNSDEADQPLFIRAEFGLEAGQRPPAAGGLELARVRRSSRTAPIADAFDPAHPGANAIDLRFRQQLPVTFEPVASIAVSYVGGSDCQHGAGLDNLARFAHHGGYLRASVDDGVPLDSNLPSYTLVCLAGLGAFDLTTDQMTALYDYIRQGGTLFIETCRQHMPVGDPPADTSFRSLLATLGIPVRDMLPGDAVLAEPHFFAAPPPGFRTCVRAACCVGRRRDLQHRRLWLYLVGPRPRRTPDPRTNPLHPGMGHEHCGLCTKPSGESVERGQLVIGNH